MADVQTAPEISEEVVLYCTVHPDRETVLRCNNCNRPMCTQCAVRTPVGYRCRECVRGQQAVFYSGTATDPLIQFAVTVPLSIIAALIVGTIGRFLGFLFVFLIVIPASTFAGGMIADVAHRAAGRRRGRYGWLAVGAGMVLGAIGAAVIPVIVTSIWLTSLQNLPPDALQEAAQNIPYLSVVSLGWWVYIVAGTAAAIGRLRMGRITINRR